MERDNLFKGITIPTSWNPSHFELNGQNPKCYFNPNWDNSVDQNDPFESALSSIVSSPVNSNAPNNGENFVLRELIGRLGGICNSGEISPHSYYNNNNNRTNTSCYTTPLNSPPKLNLSIDNQISGNPLLLKWISGNQLPFPTDPGFAERAARFSCFGGNVVTEFPPKIQENREGLLREGSEGIEKKLGMFLRSSSMEKAEFGDLVEESSVSEQIPGGGNGNKTQSGDGNNGRKRKSIPRVKGKDIPSAVSVKDPKIGTENEESNSKRSKENEGNDSGKVKGEGSEKQSKDNSKPPEPPKDYIHVRARRGQATDSHSLAERVRREKISERMKFLQDLVPGCNKVTGKAVMLDEIINYVQSLQQQVEFLSMKLSTVNPSMDFNMEALLSKEIFQSRVSLPHNVYSVDTSAQAFPYAYQSQQGPNLHSNNVANGAKSPFSMNPLTAAIRRNAGLPMASVDGFNEANTTMSQVSPFWGDDLQSFVQTGFGQNQEEIYQVCNAGPNGTSNHMKVEM